MFSPLPIEVSGFDALLSLIDEVLKHFQINSSAYVGIVSN
jgi:hypothetical protein